MNQIVICEKPNQARKVSAAVGTKFGKVFALIGHVLTLKHPEAENPKWAEWNNDILVPAGKRYGKIPVSGKTSSLHAVGAALKTAQTVIIATDPDREGQVIAQEVLDYFGYKGKLLRALFSAEDTITIRRAFDNLQPNANFEQLYQAGIAREQIDKIYGFTMTRVASRNLLKPYSKVPLGLGRVKSPTLGIICKRELEIREFVKEDYYQIKMTVEGQNGQVTLKHAPRAPDLIKNKARADLIKDAASSYNGPVNVEKKQKRTTPPKPFDLGALQTLLGSRHGWSADKTLKTAQTLYEAELITYPRGDCRYLPETMIPDAAKMLSIFKTLPQYSSYSLKEPVIRRGKSAVWSDDEVAKAAHHAIIPNINALTDIAGKLARLSDDERKFFDYVTRQFLATIGEDYVYNQTVISANVDTPPPTPSPFSITGNTPVSQGFREILGTPQPGAAKSKSAKTPDDEEDDEDNNDVLPDFTNGEIVRSINTEIIALLTEPPPRYNEGSIITAMQHVHTTTEDPEEKKILKELKGIGRPSTYAEILKGLKEQNQIILTERVLVPSEPALKVYNLFMEIAPATMKPGTTALLEKMMGDIEQRKLTVDDVIDEMVKGLEKTVPLIIEAGKNITIDLAQKEFIKPSGKPGTSSSGTKKTSSGGNKKSTATSSKKSSASSSTSGKIYLNIPFSEKDEGKKLGARWDPKKKKWFSDDKSKLALFKSKRWV
jgi:DNA topoisomerase III